MKGKIIFGLLCILLLSCSKSKDKNFVIGFVQCCDDPWRDEMNREMQRALLFHPEITFLQEFSEFNNETQKEQVKKLLHQKVDLLIVTPNESEPLTQVLEEANNNGVPTILIDRKINSESYTAFVGADNYEIGKTAAQYLANKFPNGGNIVELTMDMSITPAVERKMGFKDGLEKNKNLKVLESFQIADLRDVARRLDDLYDSDEKIDIIFSQTDLLAKTAYDYIHKNRTGDPLFYVGIDGIPVNKGIKDVKDHILDATFLYPTGGGEAIELALKILKGEEFEKDNELLTSIIDQDNAEIMYSQMLKLNDQMRDIELQAALMDDLTKTFSTQRNTLYVTVGLLTIVLLLGAILLFQYKEKQISNQLLETQNRSINDQKNEIERVSAQARQATEEKLRFYSYVSHEFKTPLTLILTPTTEMLRRERFDKTEIKETLDLVQKNAHRLLNLVNQLLEIRQLDAGKMSFNAGTYDIVAFISEIVGDFKPVAATRKIDLQFVSDTADLPMVFDRDKMDKVLFNLISNAFKYTADKGFVHIYLSRDNDEVIIRVEDNGIGMNQEEMNHAFDLFYRGNSNVSLGTGLGLALTHEYVEMHGGKIEVQSMKNRGTEFKIRLAYQKGELEMDSSFISDKGHYIEDLKLEKSEGYFEESHEHTIVIIEDNSDMLRFLSSNFRREYSVYEAENAEDGWEEILKYIPDIIISDVTLPSKNGFALTEQVKEDFRTSHIPVILLTAKSQLESKIEGTRAGADVYISKPFNQQLLEEKVKTILENRDRIKRRYANEVHDNSRKGEGERKFLIELENLIEKGMMENTLSVEALSRELGMSRVQLYRKITALTGSNVNEYVAEFRVKKAKNLLNDSTKNVTEIAFELGFNSPAYFTTFFKQRTGKTPSEWRA